MHSLAIRRWTTRVIAERRDVVVELFYCSGGWARRNV
jgi:hypothetical protein